MRHRISRRTVIGGMATAIALPAAAQTSGQINGGRPIRLVVGATPGGTTDMIARELAESFQTAFGQPVVVENRPGAGANLAAESVARSAPDGSTLLIAYTSHTMNASLFKTLPYDPVGDFTPISLIAKGSGVLVINPALPVATLAEFVAAARAKPDRFNFAIGGLGSSLHMEYVQLKSTLKLTGSDIPYKGSSPALTDVVAGHVEAMFAPVGVAMPMIAAKRVRAIAVTSPKRMALLPDVPTIREVVPEFPQSFSWFGLLGPAKLPADLTLRLNEAVRTALQSPRLRERMEQDGSTLSSLSPDEFRSFLRTDIKYWAALVQTAGIVPE
jgi:tripartite-type tricarboxylate transporter receptor subunit TctC